MSMTNGGTRRQVLRGMLNGGAIAVGTPILDCLLNTNGTAFASGEQLPVCFTSWFYGLGVSPGRWEPKTVGANYEFGPELAQLEPYKNKINIYSGMKAFLDGAPPIPHSSGSQGVLQGTCAAGTAPDPSLDQIIADTIGTRTRFRSLEVCSAGTPETLSRRSGSVSNPSEPSPLALYARIFGADFQDPNAADFKPDVRVMIKKSVLSAVSEERARLVRQLGAADKARIDEYFTAMRQLEHRLSLQLEKPAPLAACSVPAKDDEAKVGPVIDDVKINHKLFADLLAHTFACGQTQVANVNFNGALSPVRQAGSVMTFHVYTHEDPVDHELGYQVNAAWFSKQSIDAYLEFIKSMDSIREGDRTLLDRSVVFASTDGGFAKTHSLENIPIFTAGSGGGRLKTGIHFAAKGDPVSRVGLTMQQALGVPTDSWGTKSNHTSRTITEVIA
jgi:hypothetical protein